MIAVLSSSAQGRLIPGRYTSKLNLLVLQSTNFCNLNCSYCYISSTSRRSKARMSDDVIRNVAGKLLKRDFVSDRVQILWHAGEPMACGLQYYQNASKILEECSQDGISLNYTLQTNALLVNEEWAKFFRKREFSVGVSIDGPKDLHDSNRKNWAGQSTFDRAIAGTRILLDNGVKVGVICVIGKDSLHRAAEIYEFFQDLGVDYVGFNFEEIDGANTSSSVSDLDDPRTLSAITEFWDELFTLWLKNDCRPAIREFGSLLAKIEKYRSDTNYTAIPDEIKNLGILTISSAGDVSAFAPELMNSPSLEFGDFIFGNIREAEFPDILKNGKLNEVNQLIQEGVANCEATCKYFPLCGGGNVSNKYSEHADLKATKTQKCISTKILPLDVMLSRLAQPL